jgi:hypothetical protein
MVLARAISALANIPLSHVLKMFQSVRERLDALGIPAELYSDRFQRAFDIMAADLRQALLFSSSATCIDALLKAGCTIHTVNAAVELDEQALVQDCVYVREYSVPTDRRAELIDCYCRANPEDREHAEQYRNNDRLAFLYIGMTRCSTALRRAHVDLQKTKGGTRLLNWTAAFREANVALKIRIAVIPVQDPADNDAVPTLECLATLARWPALLNAQLGGYHHVVQFGSASHLSRLRVVTAEVATAIKMQPSPVQVTESVRDTRMRAVLRSFQDEQALRGAEPKLSDDLIRMLAQQAVPDTGYDEIVDIGKDLPKYARDGLVPYWDELRSGRGPHLHFELRTWLASLVSDPALRPAARPFLDLYPASKTDPTQSLMWLGRHLSAINANVLLVQSTQVLSQMLSAEMLGFLGASTGALILKQVTDRHRIIVPVLHVGSLKYNARLGPIAQRLQVCSELMALLVARTLAHQCPSTPPNLELLTKARCEALEIATRTGLAAFLDDARVEWELASKAHQPVKPAPTLDQRAQLSAQRTEFHAASATLIGFPGSAERHAQLETISAESIAVALELTDAGIKSTKLRDRHCLGGLPGGPLQPTGERFDLLLNAPAGVHVFATLSGGCNTTAAWVGQKTAAEQFNLSGIGKKRQQEGRFRLQKRNHFIKLLGPPPRSVARDELPDLELAADAGVTVQQVDANDAERLLRQCPVPVQRTIAQLLQRVGDLAVVLQRANVVVAADAVGQDLAMAVASQLSHIACDVLESTEAAAAAQVETMRGLADAVAIELIYGRPIKIGTFSCGTCNAPTARIMNEGGSRAPRAQCKSANHEGKMEMKLVANSELRVSSVQHLPVFLVRPVMRVIVGMRYGPEHQQQQQ